MSLRRAPLRLTVVFLAASVAASAAGHAQAPAPAAAPARPGGAGVISPGTNLVTDGIPPLPDRYATVVGPYNEVRTATLATWLPDRRAMLITTRFADTAQIHAVAMPGGARKQLTFFPDRVLGAQAPRKGAADHFVFAKDVGGSEFYQLYRYDLPGGKITLLTDGKSRNSLGPYADGGDRVAYTSTRRNGRDTDLYVIAPRDPKSDRRVAELTGGGWSALDWSPDGKTILVQESVSVSESYLWLIAADSGERQLITPRGGTRKVRYEGGQFSADGKSLFVTTDKRGEFLQIVRHDLGSKQETPITGHIDWDVDDFELSPDGRTIAAVINEDGTGVLRLFDARTGKEKARPRLPAGNVGGVLWHPAGRDLGFTLTGARHPTDVYSLAVRTGKVERWTESETGGIDESETREPELVRWPSFDGRTISGYLYPPPARFTGKRPVIISIHGGPEAQFRPGFPARWRYVTNQLGVALLHPNVRGSTGYGRSFHQLDNSEKREDSVKDIGALLDWIKTQPGLDADRIMVMGGSYGGYMTFATSFHYADRIRCSFAVVGISHFVSFLERTEAYRRDLRRVEYGDERDPQMRAFLHRISPLTNAAKIKKPIFIAQGRNDPRVPASEAEQILATLEQQKTPAWFLMANDEGHGFAKKRNADFLFYATVAFIEKFLLGQGAS